MPITPNLVIYADGQLFTYQWGYDGWHYFPYLVTFKLSQQAICALLNTIDQVGFFQYDPSTYNIDRFGRLIESYPSEGASEITLQVNAWQSNTFSGYSPGYFIEYEEEFLDWPKEMESQPPTILPPLRDTLLIIGDYTPDGFSNYRPDALELWMFPPSDSKNLYSWPENLPPLGELFENAEELGYSDGKKIKVEGEMWLQLSHLFDYLPIEAVLSDGDTTLTVHIIPLLPYPYPTDLTPYCENAAFYAENAPPPPTTLTCQPSDGLLAIPSPD